VPFLRSLLEVKSGPPLSGVATRSCGPRRAGAGLRVQTRGWVDRYLPKSAASDPALATRERSPVRNQPRPFRGRRSAAGSAAAEAGWLQYERGRTAVDRRASRRRDSGVDERSGLAPARHAHKRQHPDRLLARSPGPCLGGRMRKLKTRSRIAGRRVWRYCCDLGRCFPRRSRNWRVT
jgi:hypothetical protein